MRLFDWPGASTRPSFMRSGRAELAPVGVRSKFLIELGDAHLAIGRIADARRCAEQGIALSREQHERAREADALRLLGGIAAGADPPDVATAETNYRQALAVASELGLRPLVAHCHLGLGRLYRQRGTSERAPIHLETATAMYREMGMSFWQDRAETELTTMLAGPL